VRRPPSRGGDAAGACRDSVQRKAYFYGNSVRLAPTYFLTVWRATFIYWSAEWIVSSASDGLKAAKWFFRGSDRGGKAALGVVQVRGEGGRGRCARDGSRLRPGRPGIAHVRMMAAAACARAGLASRGCDGCLERAWSDGCVVAAAAAPRPGLARATPPQVRRAWVWLQMALGGAVHHAMRCFATWTISAMLVGAVASLCPKTEWTGWTAASTQLLTDFMVPALVEHFVWGTFVAAFRPPPRQGGEGGGAEWDEGGALAPTHWNQHDG